MRVLDLPEPQRPRERLLRHGAAALTDRELLALVLGSGVHKCDAIDLAARLLAEDEAGLRKLAVADPHELKRIKGIGPAKAARVAAAFELARRAALPREGRRIRGSSDVARAAAGYLRDHENEHVVLVVCNSAGTVLRVAALADGDAGQCALPVRHALKVVLSTGGTAFAVAHNHPGGSLMPSDTDIETTARLRAAAEMVGLRFLDHVILAGADWEVVP